MKHNNHQNIIRSIRRKRSNGDDEYAKPFFKWAGGKSQLLHEFEIRFPPDMDGGTRTRYIEPFVGGGAVFFYVAQRFPIKESVICDINQELILTWQVVKRDVETLIQLLQELQNAYDPLDESGRLKLFYDVRDELNARQKTFDYSQYNNDTIHRASQLLFLNKTCFNGLFRLNSSGGFNVPFGKYKNPSVVNEKNLRKASALLTNTTILQGDFTRCLEFCDENSFIYIDPPYRPLNKTSSFTSYSQDGFSEQDQIRLREFFGDIDKTGAKVMLSNSDPRNEDPNDHFFDDLYQEYCIERVLAKRMINSIAEKRGAINELIIRNYLQ